MRKQSRHLSRAWHREPVARTILSIFVLLGVAAGTYARTDNHFDCEGPPTAENLPGLIHALFDPSGCPAEDMNADGARSAADMTAHIIATGSKDPIDDASPTARSETPEAPVERQTQTPTSSPPPALTATASLAATSTLSPTPTPTLAACPGAASFEVFLNDTTEAADVRAVLSGHQAVATCRNDGGLAEFYEIAVGRGVARITGLAPGVWLHRLRVEEPALGQQQSRRLMLLADKAPARIKFDVMASVFIVRSLDDRSGGNTLRDALLESVEGSKPMLIRFDDDVFPPGEPATIELAGPLPPLAASQVTIDALDAHGLAGNRIIDAKGQPISALRVAGSFNTLIGLKLRNSGQNNRDVLSIAGSTAYGNRVERCIIEASQTGDAIGVDSGAGIDFLEGANVIRDSEITGASDKGIKVTTGSFARVERCWIHDNTNGGLQTTLSGNVMAIDNLIERNSGWTAQNGISVNGVAPESTSAPSVLVARGNISRSNGGSGLSLRGYSIATIENGYFVGNQRDGIRISGEDRTSSAAVQGSTMACNAANGAVVDGRALADFGGGNFGSSGSNAFTQNNLAEGKNNFLNATGQLVSTLNNQWGHCGTMATCNDLAIAAYDINDHGYRTSFEPTQAHRIGGAPVITEVRPTRGVAGDLIRIIGAGFNAIDAHDAAQCMDLTVRNRCAPLRGNCVRLGEVPAVLEAATPTMLVIRLPFSCVGPLPLTVTTQGGGTSAPFPICTNAVP